MTDENELENGEKSMSRHEMAFTLRQYSDDTESSNLLVNRLFAGDHMDLKNAEESIVAFRTADEQLLGLKNIRNLPLPGRIGRWLDRYMPPSYRIEKWYHRWTRLCDSISVDAYKYYARYTEIMDPIKENIEAKTELARLLDGKPTKEFYSKEVVEIAMRIRALDDAFREYTGRGLDLKDDPNHFPHVEKGSGKNAKQLGIEDADYSLDPDEAYSQYFARNALAVVCSHFNQTVRTELKFLTISKADIEYTEAWLKMLEKHNWAVL